METNALPLVSVGIPTYNGGHRIFKPLESIWKQNYPNIEILISDNCSTDTTQNVIEELQKNHPEIKYFRQAVNIGQMPNYSFLLKNASGKYFIWVADDDALEPEVIPQYVAFMERYALFSLVSGNIRYWKDDAPDVLESGFTFEQNSAGSRVFEFYSKVIYGGLLHGMMRTELTRDVAIRHVVGNDYHFVANLAYLGKIKNLDFVGYHKNFGGISKNFKQYAKHMREHWLVGYFPHIKIASDAYAEVMHRSPVFSGMSPQSKLALAISSFFGVLFCYYGRIVVGMRVQNYVIYPLNGLFRKPLSKV